MPFSLVLAASLLMRVGVLLGCNSQVVKLIDNFDAQYDYVTNEGEPQRQNVTLPGHRIVMPSSGVGQARCSSSRPTSRRPSTRSSPSTSPSRVSGAFRIIKIRAVVVLALAEDLAWDLMCGASLQSRRTGSTSSRPATVGACAF